MHRKFTVLICTLAMATIALLANAGAVGAKHPSYPYTLIDLGTLGGPQSGVSNIPLVADGSGLGALRGGNHRGKGSHHASNGVAFGTADTAVLDPYGSNENGFFSGDPYVQHAFVWHSGVITDLGALGQQPANNSSSVGLINKRGDAAGFSDNGTIDPVLGSVEINAVLWKNGKIINLGTLGGSQSVGFVLNNRNQVAGSAANAIADPLSLAGWATQTRAFIWQDGVMRDLGTLGGPDSMGWFVNDGGQVAGNSYLDSTVIPAIGGPAQHPFLWTDGHMQDVGTLGGSFSNVAIFNGLNSSGEVVGLSTLAGDQANHAFLWDGQHLVDLGTLGGSNSLSSWINDAGEVVGSADLLNGNHDGFLWKKGTMQALLPANAAPCANALAINASDDVVGDDTDCKGHELEAVLWKDGTAFDLNTLVAPSPLHMTFAPWIDDQGEIAGLGRMPDGTLHSFMLVPNKH